MTGNFTVDLLILYLFGAEQFSVKFVSCIFLGIILTIFWKNFQMFKMKLNKLFVFLQCFIKLVDFKISSNLIFQRFSSVHLSIQHSVPQIKRTINEWLQAPFRWWQSVFVDSYKYVSKHPLIKLSFRRLVQLCQPSPPRRKKGSSTSLAPEQLCWAVCFWESPTDRDFR